MSKKRIIMTISIVFVVLLISSGLFIYQKFRTGKEMVNEMFQLNSQRRAEGYYMAEFEFQIVGILYYLDKGKYKKASSLFEGLYNQLKSGQRLIKVPKFANKKEELAFYLDRQNPKTGAFMDDSYPLCTYFQPTLNVIDHMEYLAKSIGQPLQLKYPLTFIEQLDSPEELRSYLDDLATVGKLVSKMPKTPNVLSSLVSYDDLERLNLYTFSPEWKKELVKWHWENQDSITGYWGVQLRSNGKLLKGGDLTTTPKFLKLLVDNQGRDRYKEFPLRYKNEMLNTTIKKSKKPVPESKSEQHEWSIDRNFAIRILTDYLWDSLSTEQKTIAKKEIESILQIMFSEFYVPAQGAFSLYAKEKKADLDGTNTYLGILRRVGMFSVERQKKLWGPSGKTITNLGVFEVSQLKKNDFNLLKNSKDLNSIRLYCADPSPDKYLFDVVIVIYPKNTTVLDIVDLFPNIERWINTTPQNMGNWVSKESVRQKLETVNITPVPVVTGDIPLDFVNKILQEKSELIAIGFDVLQIPRYKIVYKFVVSTD